MNDPSMNHYEKRLYSVFKSFDVNNEESLDETAVNRLCDALQLEDRGAALVDTLFERRADRVTFAQFRNGLLSVLGEPRADPPDPPDPPPLHSDEDSSGREVAPKFVFGSKKYGRRSRPQVAVAAGEERAASASRLEGDARRPPYRRSASAADHRGDGAAAPSLALDHDRRIGRDEALALCRSLRMHSIDRRLVERIFDDPRIPETTVGDFFDRLNSSLASAMEEPAATEADDDTDEDEVGVPGERVAEAWERAGVPRPRRLLAELGFGGAAPRPPELERALDAELHAFDERPDERATLLLAALALARLRAASARRRRDSAAAERDKLRADVAEANRRAGLLALEVDENDARREAELRASLERAEARHAEELRRAAAEAVAERERAAEERAALEATAARRGEAEARARGEAAELRRRAEEAEARAAAAEERRGAAERAAARAEARAAAAEEAAAAARRAAGGLEDAERRAAELARDNERLRARSDELCAALESRREAPRSPRACAGDLSAELDSVLLPDALEELNSTSERVDPRAPADPDPDPGPSLEPPASGDSDDAEKQKLIELVKELEGALEAMRGEYDACEDYWSRKLADERAAHEADARAAADRLADLVARIADFERHAHALPPIPEAGALEAQVADLEAEFARYRREAAARLAAAAAARRPARGGGGGGELAARAHRAEAAARRLLARLAAADALVKDLYVENCRLAHARPPVL